MRLLTFTLCEVLYIRSNIRLSCISFCLLLSDIPDFLFLTGKINEAAEVGVLQE